MMESPSIILANSALEPISYISWQRAAHMLIQGSAMNLDGSPIVFTAHSQYITLDINRVIYQTSGFFRFVRPVNLDDAVGRRNIFLRDGHKCGYCGKKGTTIDHILPKSRGGKNTWENLVTACQSCNNRKRDRTPEEAGMTLLTTPGVYDPLDKARMDIQELFQPELLTA